MEGTARRSHGVHRGGIFNHESDETHERGDPTEPEAFLGELGLGLGDLCDPDSEPLIRSVSMPAIRGSTTPLPQRPPVTIRF